MREKIKRFFPNIKILSKIKTTNSKQQVNPNIQNYYQQGQVWEQAIYSAAVKSKRLSWFLSTILLGIVILLSCCLWLLIPLQRYEPYVITVDKTTGYLEMARALQPGPLADDVAVTQANIVRYINARETYDYNTLGLNYKLALLLSTGSAAQDYQFLYASTNAKALDKILGRYGRIVVSIKSVSLLNERTAQVRFSTETTTGTEITTNHYVSTVRFRYSGTPMKNEWRFDNPLGFQVTEYRRDQESLATKRTLDQ
ncbi:virB8 family protein [Bartonella choladocola]|uniref:Type IV secretion system protein virB8 n=1 Tax=Bartonella choladocola TaxID=2750995 RepID=A0A1U9MJV4_9HYPH|nr:type IV secretion system protein [Bartonella choladocola]AQT48018.1 type IV secretion system protein VirB8 [Bartonella choladocola]